MRIGLAQTNTQNDKMDNLKTAELLIDRLADQGARLIMLPEHFNFIGPEKLWSKNGEELVNSPSLARMREKAMKHSVFIHCGSIMERNGTELHNTSVVLDTSGETLAVYRKMHLFDVEVPGRRRYFESEYITAGDEPVTVTIDGVVFGLVTCYDLRFPELFRELSRKGAQVYLIPAAFTMMTGKDHWELLLRARAVENLSYVAAANQYGSCPPNHESYGRSMVIDPWGVVIAQASDGITTITAELDLDRLEEIRRTFPALDHIRRDVFG